ncbi:MAG: hypothetical protein HN729_06860 [Candidatus Marinimicrobia bacterium]|jgi:hypothetical protein|nr:hypothetical protein [Candidatus Neomarinimicrobiota bacterium]MBT3633657.1 hypothetical protein [Candidatus Neomarinimicrobiota bacterium]MBT3682390.1 hypothetical protein [Candidatus Neomarinimicrobiota bacterium]MBT3759154.1 hypothetical protein [Candidatus Neomarinimicrobiota bacterium]MBT3895573.1 hypothetical protein [Candidatus Neomarinimicrobiota bacterium]
MFDVNLLNPPGIQIGDQTHVISHRNEKTVEKNLIIETVEKKRKNKILWIFIVSLTILAIVISYLSVEVLYQDSPEIKILASEKTINPTSFMKDLFAVIDILPENTYLNELSYSFNKTKISFYSSDISILNDVNNNSINWLSGFGKIHGNVEDGGFLIIEINFDHQSKSYKLNDIIPNIYTHIYQNKVNQITEGSNFLQFHTNIPYLKEIFSDLLDQPLVLQNNLHLKMMEDMDIDSNYRVKIESLGNLDDNNN